MTTYLNLLCFSVVTWGYLRVYGSWWGPHRGVLTQSFSPWLIISDCICDRFPKVLSQEAFLKREKWAPCNWLAKYYWESFIPVAVAISSLIPATLVWHGQKPCLVWKTWPGFQLCLDLKTLDGFDGLHHHISIISEELCLCPWCAASHWLKVFMGQDCFLFY